MVMLSFELRLSTNAEESTLPDCSKMIPLKTFVDGISSEIPTEIITGSRINKIVKTGLFAVRFFMLFFNKIQITLTSLLSYVFL